MIIPRTYNRFLDLLQETQVSVEGFLYRVDFGPNVRPRYHHVDKANRCACDLGTTCPAVLSVIEHLSEGGQEVADPPPGYYPTAPNACPVCNAGTSFDRDLSSPHRGAGWRCAQGGIGHYWQAQVAALKKKLEANPWLYPPVVVRNGGQLFAWRGVQDGDQVLYPGVLREEVGS